MTTTQTSPNCESVTYESGGWISCRMPMPDVAADGEAVLRMSGASLVGNLRYALQRGQALLMGELRDPYRQWSLDDAYRRMSSVECDRTPAQSERTARLSDDVNGVLTESAFEWSFEIDESCWTTVANIGGRGCELTIRVVRGGAEVRGAMDTWEQGLSRSSQRAIARLLATAHTRVRFARYVLGEEGVAAVSFATEDRLDIELPDSVAAVLAACGLSRHEVHALSDETLANVYLDAMD